MATGHFYVTSGDVGAPQLNSSAGSLIAVLDWALDVAAAGYGGTRGWEKVYESGANYAVYRATTGNRFYLRIDDAQGEFAYARMFETMSDVSTGTNPAPNGSPQSAGYSRVYKADEAGAHSYFIAGDGRCFIMLNNKDNFGNYRYIVPLFFGDFNSYDPLDSYNTALICCGSADGSADYNSYDRSFLTTGGTNNFAISTSYKNSPSNPGGFCIRSPDGVLLSTGVYIHDPWGIVENTYSNEGIAGIAHWNSSPAIVYSPFFLLDINGASGTSQEWAAARGSNAYIRGTIPYLYSTPYAGSTGAIHGALFEDGASDFTMIDASRKGESIYDYQRTRVVLLRRSNDEPGRTF